MRWAGRALKSGQVVSLRNPPSRPDLRSGTEERPWSFDCWSGIPSSQTHGLQREWAPAGETGSGARLVGCRDFALLKMDSAGVGTLVDTEVTVERQVHADGADNKET